MIHYYRLEDKKIVRVPSFTEWSESREDNTVIKQDTLGDVFISTIFIGLDLVGDENNPLVFETMIFGGHENLYQKRYSSWDEALAGHQLAIDIITSDQHEES